jgi:hypothetical protein
MTSAGSSRPPRQCITGDANTYNEIQAFITQRALIGGIKYILSILREYILVRPRESIVTNPIMTSFAASSNSAVVRRRNRNNLSIVLGLLKEVSRQN